MTHRGLSYAKRVTEVNEIYDQHARSGLSNRAIWRKYIWPKFCISEKTFYNYINALADPKVIATQEVLQGSLF